MIPKVIHYCWFGGRPLPRLAERCIDSWRRLMPDAEIRRWDESNYDVACVPYTAAAARAGKWAFVSDYARLDIVYQHGGIYLDVDVELLKPLDDLLGFVAFCGLERGGKVNSGLAFGAEKGCRIIGEFRDDYLGRTEFRACPEILTEILERHGFIRENLRQRVGELEILPTEYFDPVDEFGILNTTHFSYARHYGLSSWYPTGWRMLRRAKITLQQFAGQSVVCRLVQLKRLLLPQAKL